jgi:purine-binding chemotaxis protein CheW
MSDDTGRRQVLEQRARMLARVPPAPPGGTSIPVLAFSLGSERYAVAMRYVHEVVRIASYAPLPRAPAFVLGLMAYRGKPLLVIDLRKLLGVPSGGLSELSRVLVLGEGEGEPDLGLLADAGDEITTVRREDLLAAPQPLADTSGALVEGVTADAWVVLDGRAILQDERFVLDL